MKKGFSLLEISIALLIIGILVSAIFTGADIVEKSRLVSARSITKSSPVSSIKNLVAWWETTSTKSFTKEKPNDSDLISKWNDIAPSKSDKISLAQSNTTYQPTYDSKGLAKLPSLKFDGNDRFITSNYFYKNYSLFVVVRTDANDRGNATSQAYQAYVIIGADIGGRANDIIPLAVGGGYPKTFSGNTETTLSSPVNIADNRPYILFNSRNTANNERVLIVNNTKVSDTNGGSNLLRANLEVGIGADQNTYNAPFRGYISEVIIFDRVLDEFERTEITNYLAKKYSIKL